MADTVPSWAEPRLPPAPRMLGKANAMPVVRERAHYYQSIPPARVSQGLRTLASMSSVQFVWNLGATDLQHQFRVRRLIIRALAGLRNPELSKCRLMDECECQCNA